MSKLVAPARCVMILLLALAATQVAAAVGELRVDVVEIEGGLREIWLERDAGADEPRRVLLRRTEAASVTPMATGESPSGDAAFATWIEGDGAAQRRWFSLTRQGQPWLEPRAIDARLLLRDAAIGPAEPLPEVPAGYRLPETGRVFVVQLETVSIPEWRATLETLGAEVLGFMPSNGHLVRVRAPFVASNLRALSFVARVEPYQPWFRLSPGAKEWAEQQPEDSASGDEPTRRFDVLAFEWGPISKRRIAQAARAMGAFVVALPPSGHGLELELTRAQLRALAAHDDVMAISPWTPRETDMDLVREDSGLNWVETELGYCGAGVRGEVLDQGVQDDHQDFDGLMLHGPHDNASHGTSTYGIVFGNGNTDGDGQDQARGAIPCAQGIFGDFETLGDRFAFTQELKAAPYFASFQSNSWGNARTTEYNPQSFEMDDIIWRLDILVTQSQSNAGDQNSRPQAWAKNVVAVGGIRHRNTLDTSDDAWSFGASIGPAADGRIKPDLHYWYDSIYTTTTGDGYTNFCCTSAATPQVAGVIGMMIEMWSEGVWGVVPEGQTVFERQPHESTLRALAINNAQQYAFDGTTHDLTRTHQGWGRPSARLAAERAARSLVSDHEQPLTIGAERRFDVEVLAGESELKVTLVYPDPPGVTSAALHRVNDLDLTVVGPGGETYRGNSGLLEGTHSLLGGPRDSLNPVENVFVQNPSAGTWSVIVEAMEINQDAHLETPEADAVFSLVVTGAAEAAAALPGVSGGLAISRSAGSGLLELSWDADCGGTTRYAVYRGDLAVGYSSLAPEPSRCEVAGLSTTVPEGAGAADFFLVVPRDASFEGSYGADSEGAPRLPALAPCLPQDALATCAP